jgi:hypothetical protein
LLQATSTAERQAVKKTASFSADWLLVFWIVSKASNRFLQVCSDGEGRGLDCEEKEIMVKPLICINYRTKFFYIFITDK